MLNVLIQLSDVNHSRFLTLCWYFALVEYRVGMFYVVKILNNAASLNKQ
jgi:hypothetical protein